MLRVTTAVVLLFFFALGAAHGQVPTSATVSNPAFDEVRATILEAITPVLIEFTHMQSERLGQALARPGAPDGKVKIEDATDWGYQPYFGLTWQMTDRTLLGVVYRAEADVKLEGDLNFRNLVIDKPKADDKPKAKKAAKKKSSTKKAARKEKAAEEEASEASE